MSTALYESVIFGPVRSRRLGLSLGVNLLPLHDKLCSFDCIYCECGWGKPGAKPRFNSRETVRRLLREKLTEMVGDRVKVKANMGRTRVIERMGVIKNVHPAVFIVEVDERRGRKSRQSYQYADVLTGTVELFDPETGEHIFTPFGTQLEEH